MGREAAARTLARTASGEWVSRRAARDRLPSRLERRWPASLRNNGRCT